MSTFPVTAPAAPTNFANFGAQWVLTLSAVTQLAGTGNSSLAAIPTAGLQVPFLVMVVIAGEQQQWELQAGTAATSPGIQQPADFDEVLNAKVWVLQG